MFHLLALCIDNNFSVKKRYNFVDKKPKIKFPVTAKTIIDNNMGEQISHFGDVGSGMTHRAYIKQIPK
jgi:hypothetical protein